MPSVAAVKITPVSIRLSPRTTWRYAETTNEVPSSNSHWMFCVTSPRFDVRLRNTRSTAAAPFRPARPAGCPGRTRRGATRPRPAGCPSTRVVVGGEDPGDDEDQAGGQDGSELSNGWVGSGGTRSSIRRARNKIVPTTTAWKRTPPPTDHGGDEPTDQRAGGRADATRPLIPPNGHAWDVRSAEQHRREDIVGWDQESVPMPSSVDCRR